VSEEDVTAGIETVRNTVGLTGLVPLEVIEQPPVQLRLAPGHLRLWIDLPAGVRLDLDAPTQLRIYGGEAGFEFDHNGQIVDVAANTMPIDLPYHPRRFPAAPRRGTLVIDLSFRFLWGEGVMIQDVQWRQPVVWDRQGGTALELHYALAP
jgi:hypothetical protein